MLRWRSLGEFLLINITWGQKVSGGPTSWTQLSHLGGSGPIPGWSTKSLPATELGRKGRRRRRKRGTDRMPRQMVKAKLNRKNHTKKHTHTLTKGEKKKRKRETKPIHSFIHLYYPINFLEAQFCSFLCPNPVHSSFSLYLTTATLTSLKSHQNYSKSLPTTLILPLPHCTESSKQ